MLIVKTYTPKNMKRVKSPLPSRDDPLPILAKS